MTRSSSALSGTTALLIATALFALMNIGVKAAAHIPSHEVVFFRALVSLLLGFVQIRMAGLSLRGNAPGLLLLRGLFGTFALTLYFYTLQHMPLASAVTIQHLAPIFTLLIAGFFLKEKAAPIQWLFVLASFVGVFLIKGFDPRVSEVELLLGMGAAFFAGAAYNVVRKLRGIDHPTVVVFYFPLVTLPIISPYVFTHWVAPQGWDWPLLIGIGVTTHLAQLFMTYAYQADTAANIVNLNYLGVIYALFFGYMVFGETLSPLALTGIGLIMISVVLSTRFRRK